MPTPPVSRPRVRVNQLAYLASGPVRATLICDAAEPVAFELQDSSGAVVAAGRSTPADRPDATSGLAVHVIDCGRVAGAGEAFTLVAEGERSHPFAIGGDSYARLQRDALDFFTLQRSGFAIEEGAFPGYGRPPGHVGRAPNAGDTSVGAWTGPAAEKLYPGWSFAGLVDASGGWYDAGDHGKYVVNGGISVAQLMSSHERSHRVADTHLPRVLEEARWELEWFLRMQVPAGDALAGMVFHKLHDESWTGLPMLPSEDPRLRVLHRPSTAATLNLAATAAHGARVFRSDDPDFGDRLLIAARIAYAAAQAHPALFAPAGGEFGGGPYDDTDVSDEFYWAAAELYLATGESAFLADIESSRWHKDPAAFDLTGFDWQRVAALARLDLATVSSDLPGREAARASVCRAADALIEVQAAQPWDQPYAPADGIWVWGSNGRILNNLVVLATAYDISGVPRYRDAVATGMGYLLGRNALGLSYVTGYGSDDVHHQHSRHFAHGLDPSLPAPPPGAIAGGPNTNLADFAEDAALLGLPPQLCYQDVIESFATNEVAINWNSGLVWVAGFLAAADPPTGARG